MKTASYSPQIRIVPLAVPNGRYQTGKQTLQPTELRTERRIFLLTRPLHCKIEKQGQYWFASNEEFAIEVPAKTRSEAERTFAEAFEELYEFFIEMQHSAATDGVRAKQALFQEYIQAIYQR